MSYVTHAFREILPLGHPGIQAKVMNKNSMPNPWSRRGDVTHKDIGALLALIRKVRWRCSSTGSVDYACILLVYHLSLFVAGEMESYRDMEEIDVFHAF